MIKFELPYIVDYYSIFYIMNTISVRDVRTRSCYIIIIIINIASCVKEKRKKKLSRWPHYILLLLQNLLFELWETKLEPLRK